MGAFQKSAFANNAFQVDRTVTGNVDATLPSLTCEAVGTVEMVTGDVDVSLPALVAEASGVVAAVGNSDMVLPTLTVEASGTIGARQRRGGGSARYDPLPDRFYFRPRPQPVEQPLPIGLVRRRADCTLPALNAMEPQFTDEEVLEILDLLDDARRVEGVGLAEALGRAVAEALKKAA